MASYEIGRPFTGYEYTTVEAQSFEDALELANHFGAHWKYNNETHETSDGPIWVRNLDTLEDRNY